MGYYEWEKTAQQLNRYKGLTKKGKVKSKVKKSKKVKS